MARLPVGSNAGYLADLGTAWVNLGCSLMADDAADSPRLAREAFCRATYLLENLPVGANPRFRHNLAAAWMNRADASARIRPGDAEPEYERAIEIARILPLDEKASFRVLLASTWINLGNLRLGARSVFRSRGGV